MRRLHQIMLIASVILASWLGMQIVHEFGHVLGARLTGGSVRHVALNPLSISRTDLADNPYPLVVVWAGPLVGIAAPLLLWSVASAVRLRGVYVLRFFAGFCLVANGLYIGVGSYNWVGDCGEMLRHGSQPWQLCLFGAITVPPGIWLWHGLGPRFGLREANGHVDGLVAYITLAMLVALLAFGFVVGS